MVWRLQALVKRGAEIDIYPYQFFPSQRSMFLCRFGLRKLRFVRGCFKYQLHEIGSSWDLLSVNSYTWSTPTDLENVSEIVESRAFSWTGKYSAILFKTMCLNWLSQLAQTVMIHLDCCTRTVIRTHQSPGSPTILIQQTRNRSKNRLFNTRCSGLFIQKNEFWLCYSCLQIIPFNSNDLMNFNMVVF